MLSRKCIRKSVTFDPYQCPRYTCISWRGVLTATWTVTLHVCAFEQKMQNSRPRRFSGLELLGAVHGHFNVEIWWYATPPPFSTLMSTYVPNPFDPRKGYFPSICLATKHLWDIWNIAAATEVALAEFVIVFSLNIDEHQVWSWLGVEMGRQGSWVLLSLGYQQKAFRVSWFCIPTGIQHARTAWSLFITNQHVFPLTITFRKINLHSFFIRLWGSYG